MHKVKLNYDRCAELGLERKLTKGNASPLRVTARNPKGDGNLEFGILTLHYLRGSVCK